MSDNAQIIYEILKVNLEATPPNATVKFVNPYKTGPEDTVNVDAEKTVNIPLTGSGIDQQQWTERLEQQALGARSRFISKRDQATAVIDVEALTAQIMATSGSIGQEVPAPAPAPEPAPEEPAPEEPAE